MAILYLLYGQSAHTLLLFSLIPAILPIAYVLEILLYSVLSYAVPPPPAMPCPQLASLANSSFKTQFKMQCPRQGCAAINSLGSCQLQGEGAGTC